MPTPTPGSFTAGESTVQYAVSEGNFVPALVLGLDGTTPPVLSLFVYVAGVPGFQKDLVTYDANGVAGTYKYDVAESTPGNFSVGGNLAVTGNAAVTGTTDLTGLTTAGALHAGATTATSLSVNGNAQTGTNSGDLTLAAVGSSPSANGASLSGQALTLQPADATHPGLVTTGSQTWAGAKKFTSKIDLTTAANSTPLIGGDFAVGFGISFPASDNSIYLRTGSNLSGAVRVVDVGGNLYADITSDGLDMSSATPSGRGKVTYRYTDGTGTPGNATVNKPSGRNVVASGAQSCVITSNTLTANSIIKVQMETAGAGVVNCLVTAHDATTFTVKTIDSTGALANTSANVTFSWIVSN